MLSWNRSGPLPASLASATCPLLRGTLEGAGASCGLTGTRGTGWSAAKHKRGWQARAVGCAYRPLGGSPNV